MLVRLKGELKLMDPCYASHHHPILLKCFLECSPRPLIEFGGAAGIEGSAVAAHCFFNI